MSRRAHLDELTPAARLVGREVLEIDDANGVVRLAFRASPDFANRHGTVAGGFLAAMLDSTTAAPILAFLDEDRTIVTTELHITYERPASIGRLIGTGRVARRDDRVVHAEGELADAEGNVVARGTTVFRIVRRRPPGGKTD